MAKKLVLGFSSLFLLLEILFVGFITYTSYIDLQTTLSNSLISSKAKTVIFREKQLPLLSEFVESYPNIMISVQLEDSPELGVVGVCGNPQLKKNIRECISGDYFGKGDFFKKENKAILGKDIINSELCFVDSSGKKQFNYNNSLYEIIGEFSPKVSEMLNKTAFINLDSIFTDIPNIITIDSVTNQSVSKATLNIQKSYSVDFIPQNNNFIERYLLNGLNIQTLQTFVMFFIVSLVVMLAVFSLYYYNQEIKVKQMLGFKHQQIYRDLYGIILLLTSTNILIVLASYTMLYFFVLRSMQLEFCLIYVLFLSLSVLTVVELIVYLYIVFSYRNFHRNGVS